MSLTLLLLSGLWAVEAPLPAPSAAIDSAVTTVTVDSSKHTVVITTGPYRLENMPPAMPGMMMDHGASHDTPVERFQWPVDGWFRGFKLEVLDANGNPLPRRIMHHMIMVNFDRRQLIYQAAERLMGAGTETADAELPKTVGVPLDAGTMLGFYIAWHNDTGRDLDGVTLRITMLWTPTNQVPRPVSVMPLYMDVNLDVGGTNTFDVPPGKSEKAFVFTVPVDGRLLGVSGHLHDYGVGVRLEDVASGKVLTRVAAKRKPDGTVTGMERNLFGVSGRGLALKAGRSYRVVGVYDNPTGEMIHNGAMASMVGIFAPDKPGDWPAIDEGNLVFQRDLESLRTMGRPSEATPEHQHGGHSN